jgi:hypothetical protein
LPSRQARATQYQLSSTSRRQSLPTAGFQRMKVASEIPYLEAMVLQFHVVLAVTVTLN